MVAFLGWAAFKAAGDAWLKDRDLSSYGGR